MDVLEAIRHRYSLRRYAERPVPRDSLERCLEAARLAPSACNSQPWRFIVVDDPNLRDRVARAAFSGLYSLNRFAAKAPVLVVAITDRSRYIARLGGQLRRVQYSLIDLGIACEHLALQATEEGLGTCWLGWFSERGVRNALGLPRSDRIDILLSLGYPETEEIPEKKRRAIEDVRQFNGP